MKEQKETDQTSTPYVVAARARRVTTSKFCVPRTKKPKGFSQSNIAVTEQQAEFRSFSGWARSSSRASPQAPTKPRPWHAWSRFLPIFAWTTPIFTWVFSQVQRRLNSIITGQFLSLIGIAVPPLLSQYSPSCMLQRLAYPALPMRCGPGNSIRQFPISPVSDDISLPLIFGAFDKLPATVMIVAILVANVDKHVITSVPSMDHQIDFKPLGERLRSSANSKRRFQQIDHIEQSIAAFNDLFLPFAAEELTLYHDCKVGLLNQVYNDISLYHHDLSELAKVRNETFHTPIYEWIEPWMRASHDQNHVHVTRKFLRSIKTHSDDRCLSQVRLIQASLSSMTESLSRVEAALYRQVEFMEADGTLRIALPLWWRSSLTSEDLSGIRELHAYLEAYKQCRTVLRGAASRIAETKSALKLLVRQSAQLAGLFDKMVKKPSSNFHQELPKMLDLQTKTLADLLYELERLNLTSAVLSPSKLEIGPR